MSELILREDKDGLCILTLNRPESLNAFNRDLSRAFKRHVDALAKDEGKIATVILRGAGKCFCAGHDLKETNKDNHVGFLRYENRAIERLSELPQPVIAAVHGFCMTGGIELALACDFIVAGESARFADTHAKWGLVPGWGVSQRLPRRVGSAKALEMMLTARQYTGQQAEAMGLANVCVPDDKLMETAEGLARDMMKNAWHSLAAYKRLVYETDGMRLKEGIAHEVWRNEGFSEDRDKRVQGFVEKKDKAS